MINQDILMPHELPFYEPAIELMRTYAGMYGVIVSSYTWMDTVSATIAKDPTNLELFSQASETSPFEIQFIYLITPLLKVIPAHDRAYYALELIDRLTDYSIFVAEQSLAKAQAEKAE